MWAPIKKIRVLKALVLVVLVLVVSPKWRLCVSANAEEDGESKSSNTTTNTTTKDDGERRGIFGELFSSWFSEGQKQTLTPSFVGKCRERCKGLNVSSGPMCDTKNNATYANECWFRCKHDLEESGGKRACVYEACLGAKDVMEFQPVCRETGETFANECIATCAKVRYAEGSCF
ncbi:unnamed protein product [Bathycoccus prasinos]